jgi:predicted nucleic acid-binding protein
MNGNSVLLDTNIVLYLLSGDKVLSDLLHKKKLYLSFVSQLELLGFKGITTKQSVEINKFILDCVVIDINEEIKRV